MAEPESFCPDLPRWHLAIGECIVTQQPAVINTVLGSCVAVTFLHKHSHMAAIFHAMLPTSKNKRGYDGGQPCKYVDSAIERIMDRFTSQGVPPKDIAVKLFGGAFSLGERADEKTRAMIDMGTQNVAMAEKELKKRGMRILSRDTHGTFGRKLYFDTSTGNVWLRSLSRLSPELMRQAICAPWGPPL